MKKIIIKFNYIISLILLFHFLAFVSCNNNDESNHVFYLYEESNNSNDSIKYITIQNDNLDSVNILNVFKLRKQKLDSLLLNSFSNEGVHTEKVDDVNIRVARRKDISYKDCNITIFVFYCFKGIDFNEELSYKIYYSTNYGALMISNCVSSHYYRKFILKETIKTNGNDTTKLSNDDLIRIIVKDTILCPKPPPAPFTEEKIK